MNDKQIDFSSWAMVFFLVIAVVSFIAISQKDNNGYSEENTIQEKVSEIQKELPETLPIAGSPQATATLNYVYFNQNVLNMVITIIGVLNPSAANGINQFCSDDKVRYFLMSGNTVKMYITYNYYNFTDSLDRNTCGY